jgi:hypothetical protein
MWLGGSRTVSYKGMFCHSHTHASVPLTKISNNRPTIYKKQWKLLLF